MAEKETKFEPWMMALGGAVVVAAISGVAGLLWQGNTAITRQGEQIATLTSRIDKLETTISNGAQTRYTAADAARDHEAIAQLCAANAKIMADTFDKVNEANRRIDERIRALEIWQAEFKGSHK